MTLTTDERAKIRTVITDLEGSRNTLLTQGWTRNAFQNRRGRVCAAGAINLFCTGDAEGDATVGGLARALQVQKSLERTLANRDTGKGYGRFLLSWNDRIAKSRNAVVALFNDTIARLKDDLRKDDNARRRAARAARKAEASG